MRLIDRARAKAGEQRFTVADLSEWMSAPGVRFPSTSMAMRGSDYIEADPSFTGYVSSIHRRNPVVSAAVTKRAQVLSQMRFQWRPLGGQDRTLFDSPDLNSLNRPEWMPRPQLLTLAEYHASYSGNAFIYRDATTKKVRLLEPDWVTIAIGAEDVEGDMEPLHREVLGYIYQWGGKASKAKPIFIPAANVGHWAPEPDPVCWWRGESWVSAVAREVATDDQATDHLAKFYENAATPQAVFSFDATLTPTQINEYAALIHEDTAGTKNAWKSLVLGGGADVQIVGSQLASLDYRGTQGGHESRIAMRSHVPAVILQAAEGFSGSALNSGNYTATRRMWADLWVSSAGDSFCASVEGILTPPRNPAELTFDPARIQFLQEDRKDEAEIQQFQAVGIRNLVEAGYDPATVIDAMTSGDLSKLTHTGNVSVQLQPPGATDA